MPDTRSEWYLYDILVWNNPVVENGSVVFTADSISRAQRVVERMSMYNSETDRYSIVEKLLTEQECVPTGTQWLYKYKGQTWRKVRNE